MDIWILIRRSNEKFVARPDEGHCYTSDIRRAQRFDSREEAIKNSCVESEYPTTLDAWLSSQ